MLKRFQSLGAGIAFAAIPLVSVAAAHSSSIASTTSVAVQGATLSIQHTFNNSSDGLADSPMTAGPGGALYGIAYTGGANGMGTIYKVGTDGSFAVVHAFDVNEGWPLSSQYDFPGLTVGSDGSLYGTTTDVYAQSAGQLPASLVFRIAPNGQYSVLHKFAAVDNPDASSNNQPYINADGAGSGIITLAADGTVYGVKQAGGTNGTGTVFKIDPKGNFTLLHTFTATDSVTGLNDDGAVPVLSLAVATGGSLYGVTEYGGTNGYGTGTLFKITSAGVFGIVRMIDDSASYDWHLLAGKDGNIYGRVRYTSVGNTSGYIFKLDSAGTFSKLYTAALNLNFKHNYVDDLILGADGNLYSVIDNTGEAIVRVTPTGRHSVLHTFGAPTYIFGCGDGCSWHYGYDNLDGHFSTLRQGSDGNLYGVSGDIFKMGLDGSAFTVMFTFGSGNGYNAGTPSGQTADDGQGNLYGILYGLNPQGQNTLYKLVPNGPVRVTASATPSSVAAGQTTTLTWSSTGAASCALDGDLIPQDGQYQGLPASGSISVTAPKDFAAGRPGFNITFYTHYLASIQCTAASGGVANTILSVSRQ